MYSEHVIAELVRLVDGSFATGKELDSQLGRVTVQVGRVIGTTVGAPRPTDISLTWWASRKGTPVPVGTRGAVHVLPDSRTGMGLGPSRGVVESAGGRLVTVKNPESNRYVGAYKLPGVSYGGLI